MHLKRTFGTTVVDGGRRGGGEEEEVGREGGLRAGRVVRCVAAAVEDGDGKVLREVVGQVREEVWGLVAERMARRLGGVWTAEACRAGFNGGVV